MFVFTVGTGGLRVFSCVESFNDVYFYTVFQKNM